MSKSVRYERPELLKDVDKVAVVRCRDCRHSLVLTNPRATVEPIRTCAFRTMVRFMVDDMGFCDHGEAKA